MFKSFFRLKKQEEPRGFQPKKRYSGPAMRLEEMRTPSGLVIGDNTETTDEPIPPDDLDIEPNSPGDDTGNDPDFEPDDIDNTGDTDADIDGSDASDIPDDDIEEIDNIVDTDDTDSDDSDTDDTAAETDSDTDDTAAETDSDSDDIADEDLEPLDYIDPDDTEGEDSTTDDTTAEVSDTGENIASDDIDTAETTSDDSELVAETDTAETASDDSELEDTDTAETTSDDSELVAETDTAETASDDSELVAETDAAVSASEDSELVAETDTAETASNTTEEASDNFVVDAELNPNQINFDVGTFTVGETGQVSADFLFDGGKYEGEVAIFNIEGMDEFEFGSPEFIQEAARRSLSSSDQGHIVISDLTAAAKFDPQYGQNYNLGTYQGVQTFAMRPGDTFAVMLVPKGSVQQVFDNPAATGNLRPLFSLATANPNDAHHIGQIADVTGDGSTFAMEDLRIDGNTDKDYNDIVFQVRGAKGTAPLMDQLVAAGKDWRGTNVGKALIEYAKPYITPDEPDFDGALSNLVSNLESLFDDIETDPDSLDIASDSTETTDDIFASETEEPVGDAATDEIFASETEEPVGDAATDELFSSDETVSEAEEPVATETDDAVIPSEETASEAEEPVATETDDAVIPSDETVSEAEEPVATETTDAVIPSDETVSEAEEPVATETDDAVIPSEETASEPEETVATETDDAVIPSEETAAELEETVATETTDAVIPSEETAAELEETVATETTDAVIPSEETAAEPEETVATETTDAVIPSEETVSEPEETVATEPTDAVTETLVEPETENSAPEVVAPAVEKTDAVTEVSSATTEPVTVANTPTTSESTDDVEISSNATSQGNTVHTNSATPTSAAPATPSSTAPAQTSNSVNHQNLISRLDNLTNNLKQQNSNAAVGSGNNAVSNSLIQQVENLTQKLRTQNPSTPVSANTTALISRLEEMVVKTAPVQAPSQFNFAAANQPLVGVINETGFAVNNTADIDYEGIILGQDRVDGDRNPLLAADRTANPGATTLEIIQEINDDAPLMVGRAPASSEAWAQSLIEFVDAAKASGQPNAIVNLSLNLTEVQEDGEVVLRSELTPIERAAIAYAQKNNVILVVPAGDIPEEMSALGQLSTEFDNVMTIGAADRVNNSVALSTAYAAAENSGSGAALDIVADGGTGGTLDAAAKITGAMSQVWAANPDLSYRQVIDILKRTATDLKTPNWDLETGAGLLNIAAAVHLAKVTPAIDVDVPVRDEFNKSDQPLIGIIDTGFISKNPDIDYRRIILGRDRVDNDNNPLLENGEGSEHGSHILGIIGATQGNGIGIDGMNDDAPIWLGRAIGSGKWAESLREFVDAAKASGQPNAVVNLSFDLTQINPDGSVTTRYELTPQEREALEYARQNGVMVVVAAGNNGGTMSALGQASQEFDNVITVGSIDYNGNRADYSNFGFGLDFVARGGTSDRPVMSTVGEGADLGLLSGEEEPPEDEMSIIARNAFEEVFRPFSDPQELESDEQELENLTPEERQVYDEATKEIDQLLKDYLGAASQKIALEYVDGYYGASVDALSQFVDAFDEDLADNLIKAEDILGNAGFSTNASTTATNLDFSIPLDLGVGEMAGTSVAAAKVTGAVSQVWAANPRLSYPQVKEILQKTAVDLNSRGWDAATGSGLVNVEAAIELAKRTQPQSYQPKPIQSPLTWSGEGKVTPGERAVSVSVPSFTGRVMDAGYVTSVGFLRIRSGPGQNYVEVGRKYPGEAINFDAYENNGRWVDDPYMPGGGSSRWYKIAGTNNWMSALYIDNTPERAEQERQRLEAIRRAEEEARRAEEEARRAEEEARRAEEELQRILEEQRRAEEEARRRAEEEARRRIEEELRRILEEQRRQQEQLQAAISQVSQKVGDLGAQLGGYVSNGVRVYQFDKGTLLIQPDGSSAFYEAGKKVAEFFDPNKEGSFGNYIWNPAYPLGVNIANNVSKFIDNTDRIEQLGKLLAYPGFSEGMNGFVLNPPRFGKYSSYVDNVFSFVSTQSKNWDEFIEGKTFTNPGKNGFVFKTPGALPKGTGLLAKSGTIGNVLGLVPTAWEFLQAKNDQEKGKALIKGGAGILGGMAGGYIGAALFTPILPPAGSIVGGIAGSLLGGYIGEKGGEWVADNWPSIRQNVENGWNATTSAFSSAVEAAKAKAQGALEKAKAAAATAKAAYEVATTTVQQAKAAYQTFKQEIQKQTTQIVQQSQQKIKEEAQKILIKVVQNPVVQQTSKVVNHIANYAQKAVQAVGGVINGAKQFANNIINAGKKMVNNVIETGKKAYETVKNFVVNTYETGKKVVTETYNKAVQAVNTVKDTVSNGFNAVKSVFSFRW